MNVEDALIRAVNERLLEDDADQKFAHTMAERALSNALTPKMRRASFRMLRRCGIECDDPETDGPPVAPTKAQLKPRPTGVSLRYVADGDRIAVIAPFRFKDVIKAMPGRRWHLEQKFWSVQATPVMADQCLRTFVGADADEHVQALADTLNRQSITEDRDDPSLLEPIPITHTDPWDHQLRAYNAVKDLPAALLAMWMGCVTGDAEVVVNRGGASKRMRLDDLHHKFQGGGSAFGTGGQAGIKYWDLETPTLVRGLRADGTVGLVSLVATLDRGVRPIVEVTLTSGRSLRCTPDHELVTTDRKKVHAEDLVPGQGVLMDVVQAPEARVPRPEQAINRPKGTDSHGYRWVAAPKGHPRTVGHQIMEHLLVMESVIGRPVLATEVVHHLNGVPWDNRPENLVLCADDAEHARYHQWECNFPSFTVGVGVIASVEPAGEEHVYDVSVDEAMHTWVGSGFVLGNTGKTKVAVDLIRNHDAQAVLVQCPKQVLGVWNREFRTHAPDHFHVEVLTDGKRSIAQRQQRADHLLHECDCGRPHVLVINYEAAWQKPFGPWALDQHWDYVVFDESHRIKAPNGTMSKFCAKLRKSADRALALSGTPMSQSPLDVWGQYRALDESIFGPSHTSFKYRYAIMGGWQGKEVIGLNPAMEEELARLYFSIAFEVGADVLDLPGTTDVERSTQLDSKTMKIYRQLEGEMYAEIGGDAEITVPNVLVKILRLQQLTGGVLRDDEGADHEVGQEKAKLLLDVLEDIEVHVQPVVVFCRFIHDLDVVEAMCEKLGYRYSELSGRRSDLTADAKMPEDCDVMGVQIQAGGVGIDLTRAKVGIYYSVGHSLSDYEQSRSRLDRPGQDAPVLFIHLTCAGTIDEEVYEALSERQQVIDRVLDRGRRR